jgi:hypothetical protein
MRSRRLRGSGRHLSEQAWTVLIVLAAVLIVLLSSGRLGPSLSDSQRKAASDPSQFSPSMVPLVTGEEPIRELFTRAGCPVCHTIPGIGGADGRVGPTLMMGTTGPKRLADPLYRGRAKTVRGVPDRVHSGAWRVCDPWLSRPDDAALVRSKAQRGGA